jgi:glycosyltransferase involved in cell wall biosynthesis
MTHLPTFTVVVPTYDRPRQMAECLAALAELDYPRDRFEVVIVDDGSPTSPEGLVAGFGDRMDVRLLALPHGGPARARNAGAESARGEYLAFTDDDCTPAPDWLRCLAARFAESPGHTVGGRTCNRLERNPYATASQVLIDYLYGYFAPRRGRFFTANNLALPTAMFRALGGFDVNFLLPAAEDREFCLRWSHFGHPLLYAPEAVVHHAHRLDLRRFWRQHFNYGRGAYHVRNLVARRERDSVRIEPLAFYSDLLLYPLRRSRGPGSLRLSLLLALSQLANASGFFFERSRLCHAHDGSSEPGRHS